MTDFIKANVIWDNTLFPRCIGSTITDSSNGSCCSENIVDDNYDKNVRYLNVVLYKDPFSFKRV